MHNRRSHSFQLLVFVGSPADHLIGFLDRSAENQRGIFFKRTLHLSQHGLYCHFGCIISRIMSAHTVRYNKHVGQISHRFLRGIDIVLIYFSFPSDIGYGKRLEHVNFPPVRVRPGSASPVYDDALTVRRLRQYPGPSLF